MNATVNNGIIIMLAKIDITFKVLKKYAIININETVVEMLIAKLSANFVDILVLYNSC